MNLSLKVVTRSVSESKKYISERTVTKDYAPVMEEATYTTNRLDSPGQLSFTLIEQTGIAIPEGAAVYFQVDETNVFKGYVFTAERSRNRRVKYVAYDQLRYLKAKASYTFIAMSLEEIIAEIAKDFGLQVGELASTGYKIPSLVKENVSCLDIIYDALEIVTVQTGKIFIFYDDYGKLTLKEAKKQVWNRLIGDMSLLNDYSYKRSIDSDTYNLVKLVRPNKETGRADVVAYGDTDAVRQWGLLQYYATVDEGMNTAQIEEMCKAYLKYYDRVWQTLNLKKIVGFPEIRAGWIVPVRIGAIDVASTQRFFLAEKVSHKFKGDSHTMDIEVKNLTDLGGT